MSGNAALALGEDRLRVYASFDHVLELIREKRDMALLLAVESHVRLVRYSPGRIEFEPAMGAPADLAATLSQRLQGWTGARWGVSVVSSGGAQTVVESRDAAQARLVAEARQNPIVQEVLRHFPDAAIKVHPPRETLAEVAQAALPEVEDEWDPFEDN